MEHYFKNLEEFLLSKNLDYYDKFINRSPFAMCMSLYHYEQSKGKNIIQILHQDFTMMQNIFLHPDLSCDFEEGVRALLIDKDKSPRWADPDIGSVDPKMIQRVFKAAKYTLDDFPF